MNDDFITEIPKLCGRLNVKLSELIATLESSPNSLIALGKPHSYRGSYDELALEPLQCGMEVIAGDLAGDLRNNVLNKRLEGWKGGEYLVDDETCCWVSMDGECSRKALIGFKIFGGKIKIVTMRIE